MDQSLNPFTFASGVVGFISASVFAIQIHFFKIKVNLATWTMVLILDFIVVGLLFASGSKEPYLQLGWCAAAVLVFIAALVDRGDWKWTKIETYSVAACVVAVLIWVLTGSIWSLLGYLLACCISAIPQINQYRREERKSRIKSTWMWTVSIFAIVLALLGNPPTPEVLVLSGLLVLNTGIAWLTVRKD